MYTVIYSMPSTGAKSIRLLHMSYIMNTCVNLLTVTRLINNSCMDVIYTVNISKSFYFQITDYNYINHFITAKTHLLPHLFK